MKKQFPYYAILQAFSRTDFFAVTGESGNLIVKIWNNGDALITVMDNVPFDAIECTQVDFIHAYEKAQLAIVEKFLDSCPIAKAGDVVLMPNLS